jgi:hypothetical protein
MNCARVHISNGSGNSTAPSTPSQPSQSSIQPQQPAQSATQPEQPEDDEGTKAPAPTSGASDRSPQATAPTAVTTVVTTVYRTQVTEPTGSPDSTENEDDSDSSDDSDNSDNSDDSDETESSDDSGNNWWRNRPHRKVLEGARRYQVDGTRCECRRDELTLAARCSCDSSDSAIERKALRLHRRTFYKRVDACNWDSAPAMEVSYYTEDAKCAPNAKQDTPESDTFEIKWDVSCGVVEGDGEYPLKTMQCGNSFSASIE